MTVVDAPATGVPPISEELQEKCALLSIDWRPGSTTSDLLWLAEEFHNAAIPHPWSCYLDNEGRVFYYDHTTGVSEWTHPLLNTFRALFNKILEEPELREYYKDLYYKLREYCDEKKGWWALNLLVTPGNGSPPTPEEVQDMAAYLQIDVATEGHMLWIAKQAVQAVLPPNWNEHYDTAGSMYYYNAITGKSTYKHPMDDYFYALVREERTKAAQGIKKAASPYAGSEQWVPFIDDYRRKYYHNFCTGATTYFPPWDPVYNAWAYVLQRYWKRRGYRRHAAATVIQAVFRGHRVRSRVADWKRVCAAVCIQKHYRRHLDAQLARRHACARVIQAHVREWLSRREARRAQLRNAAAVTCQRLIRGHLARLSAKRLRAEAEALERDARERQRLAQELAAKERERQRQVLAAVTIQSLVRGHWGRVRARGVRRDQAARRIQSLLLVVRAKKALAVLREGKRRNLAAVTIQRAWRRHMAKRARAATCIQARYRGFKTRERVAHLRRYEQDRLHACASTIQRVFRGHIARARVRREARRRAAAAARIQRHWRRFLWARARAVRRLVARFYDAQATAVQARWRGGRSRVRSVSARAETRQAAARDRARDGATRIQAWWRGFRVRRALFSLQDLAARRQALLQRLCPLFEEVYVLPDECVSPALLPRVRQRAVTRYVFDRELAGVRNTLSEEAVQKLADAYRRLRDSREERLRRRNALLADITLYSRLLNWHSEQNNLPGPDVPGWLSDAVLEKAATDLAELHAMKAGRLDAMVAETWVILEGLWDQLRVRDSWRMVFDRSEVSQGALEGLIEEVQRLEALLPLMQPVIELVIKREKLRRRAARAAAAAATSGNSSNNESDGEGAHADTSQWTSSSSGTSKAAAAASSTRDAAPRVNHKLRKLYKEMGKLLAPLGTSWSEVRGMCDIPTAQELQKEWDAYVVERQQAKEREAAATGAAGLMVRSNVAEADQGPLGRERSYGDVAARMSPPEGVTPTAGLTRRASLLADASTAGGCIPSSPSARPPRHTVGRPRQSSIDAGGGSGGSSRGDASASRPESPSLARRARSFQETSPAAASPLRAMRAPDGRWPVDDMSPPTTAESPYAPQRPAGPAHRRPSSGRLRIEGTPPGASSSSSVSLPAVHANGIADGSSGSVRGMPSPLVPPPSPATAAASLANPSRAARSPGGRQRPPSATSRGADQWPNKGEPYAPPLVPPDHATDPSVARLRSSGGRPPSVDSPRTPNMEELSGPRRPHRKRGVVRPVADL
eukprot:jgi/Mesvir1/6830/Mv09011-RA.1